MVLFLACVVAAAAGGAAETTSQPYDYGLAARDGLATHVQLDDGGFAWPSLDAGIDTAILELEVEARRSAEVLCRPWWSRPPARTSTQYFERRALWPTVTSNLSELFRDGWPARGTRVALRGRGLRWSSGSATLHAFSTPDLRAARVLVVAPHPDDAEIAAFGLYSGNGRRRRDRDQRGTTAA